MHQKAKTSQITATQPYILYSRNISISSVSSCIRAGCSHKVLLHQRSWI